MSQPIKVELQVELAKEGPDFRRSLVQLASVDEGYVQILDVPEDDSLSAMLELTNLDTISVLAIANNSTVNRVCAEYTNRELTNTFPGNARLIRGTTGSTASIQTVGATFDWVAAGWVAGSYVRVADSTGGLNDGTYIIGRVTTTTLVLGEAEQFAVTSDPDAATVSLSQEFRNRAFVGAGEFHFTGLGTLVKEDGLVLRSTPAAVGASPCEAWIYGS